MFSYHPSDIHSGISLSQSSERTDIAFFRAYVNRYPHGNRMGLTNTFAFQYQRYEFFIYQYYFTFS